MIPSSKRGGWGSVVDFPLSIGRAIVPGRQPEAIFMHFPHTGISGRFSRPFEVYRVSWPSTEATAASRVRNSCRSRSDGAYRDRRSAADVATGSGRDARICFNALLVAELARANAMFGGRHSPTPRYVKSWTASVGRHDRTVFWEKLSLFLPDE